jgi:hypothetical protein
MNAPFNQMSGVDPVWPLVVGEVDVDPPAIVYYSDQEPRDAALIAFLARRAADHRYADLDVLAETLAALNSPFWEKILIPSMTSVNRGDFGEDVTALILQDHLNLIIPVHKLRYKITANQTLPGTDLVALACRPDGQIEALHLAESKLSTSGDLDAGAKAHSQLQIARDASYATILLFVARAISRDNPSLLREFIAFLRNRSDFIDQHHIALTYEAATWSDEVLSRLPERPELVEPLTVHVTLLEGLASLIESVYGAMSRLLRVQTAAE